MADGAEAQPSDKKEHKHRHKEHKHKERDREKDRHRDRERTKEHGKDRKEDRERHRSSRGDREHKRERSDRDRGSEEARASKRQDRRDSLEANEVDVERQIHAVKDAPEAQVTDMGMGDTAPSDSGAVADPSPELAAIKPQVQESGGEVSMSIEETNRVRISLGLKPLSMENSADTERKEVEAKRKVQREQQQAAEAAALAERVQKRREKRLLDESLRKVKTLGQADEDVDDLAKWVTKSRTTAEEEKELARLQAAAAALKAEQEEEEDEEAQARGLTGLKVKHTADELQEGETMILTLADKNILDEKGDLSEGEDELENVLAAEHKKRDKARKASSKPASRFEEDQKKRGLLDKYDEEEEEAAMLIGDQGIITDDAKRRQEEIRAKLTTINAKDRPAFDQAKDYYTSEEAAQFQKPVKKMRKKVRAKKGEDEGKLDLAALEAEAAANAGSSDKGSRKTGAAKQAKADADRAADEAKRQSRYDAALEKAKYAALAMKHQAEDDVIGDDDEDLYASLARARKAAEKQMQAGTSSQQDSLAEQLASRRDQDEAQQAMDTENGAPAGEGMEFTEASEFARSIQLREPEDSRAAESASHMGVDDGAAAAAAPQPSASAAPKQRKSSSKWGSWVSATEDGEEVEQDEEMADAPPPPPSAKPQEEEQSLIREAAIGKGMAGVLGLLKERGELSQRMQWAGRTNDMKPVMLQGLEEVYQSGGHADQIANRVEMALTRRDEYGRVLTPKQAFREVSYRFHGIEPSKKSKEKIQRKVRDEMAAKKAAGSEQPAGSFNHLKHAQAKTNTPYVVLTGNIRPGQSSDPKSGYATVDSQVALTPVLGGGKTPLTGDRKVEAMLGIRKRAGNDSMPPPASRLAKKSK